MITIFNRLENWRKERGLDLSQGFGFDLDKQVSFITEEVTEYLRAENEYEEVDALCDIMVFCINGSSLLVDPKSRYEFVDINSDVSIYDIFEQLSSIKSMGDQTHHSFFNCIDTCRVILRDMGYDLNKCMDETLKEIESRRGGFNSISGKWEKFKDEESKKLWYKADYSKCKSLSTGSEG